MSRSTSAAAMRLAALRIVSPSGMALSGQRQLAWALAEAHLDQDLLHRGADHRLAVEALYGELADPPLVDVLGEGLQRGCQERLVVVSERDKVAAVLLR